MKYFNFLLFILSLIFFNAPSYAETVITYRAPESADDPRYEYDNALLRLALDKTVEEYGPYRMEASPVMNFARAIRSGETNYLPNFFFKLSYAKEFTGDMIYAPIPLDRGIVGYRVFFVSQENRKRLENLKTLDELKALSVIQGRGWSDIAILEQAGFQVDVQSSYEQLFNEVASGHSVLFPRGANELLSEYEAFSHVKGLDYDRKFVLYYPLPRFFFTHKSNKEALERVTLGLEKAWADGSFQKLWEEQYLSNIKGLNLSERQIFEIENPMLEGLGDEYKSYIYNPFAVEAADAGEAEAQ